MLRISRFFGNYISGVMAFMKKSIYLLFIVFALFVISSCMRERYPPPLGVWESEYPRLVLYLSRTINPVTGSAHSGVYYANGVSTETVSSFRSSRPVLEIYDAVIARGSGGFSDESRLLSGTHRIIDNQRKRQANILDGNLVLEAVAKDNHLKLTVGDLVRISETYARR